MLNFKEYKKTNEDDKTAEFQHPDGHCIKILKHVLTPKMRGEVEKLPLANGGKVKMYADPDEPVSKDDSAPEVRDSSQEESRAPEPAAPTQAPVVINVGGGQPQPAAAPPPQQSVQPQAPATAPAPAEAPGPIPQDEIEENPQAAMEGTPAAQSAPQAQAPEAPPNPNNDFQMPNNVQESINQPSPTQSMQQKFAANKQAHLERETQEDNAFEQDLANGHITPKTYQSLFADKSTLGKIGSIFGLIVGGAGAGLAHQQNALLGMWDKTIQNDLAAQQHSKENAQNFLRLNQADLANKAASLGSLENAKTAALTRTQSQLLQSSYHDMLMKAQALPPKEQAKAMQVLQTLYPELKGKINNINDLASSAMSVNDINPFKGNQTIAPQNGQPNAPQGPSGANKLPGQTKSGKPDYSTDHILKPGASDQFTKSQYKPSYNPDKDEVQKQLQAAAQTDKAIDVLNEHFPQMVANIKNIKHPSGLQKPLGADYTGLSTLGDIASDASGFIHRQSEGLSSIPYIGEALGAPGKIATSTQKNRDFDLHRGPVATAMANVLVNSGGQSPTSAQEIINSIIPEIGDTTEMSRNKLKTAIEKLKTATVTTALDRHGLTRNKQK